MLYIKKEKVLDKKALKGAADNTTDNSGPIYKEIQPVKLNFSATNFKAKVTRWRLSIENKTNTLFPTVCDTAHGIAGIAAATADSTQLEHQDPQILAQANLASDDEDSAEEHEEDNTQAIDEDHDDKFNKHHDNGVDNGNNSVVDEEHNSGGDNLVGHDNEGDDLVGHNNEEGEDKATLG